MRKALRIISISAGIISLMSALVLAYIYMEDALKHMKKIKLNIENKINSRAALDEEYDYE